MNKKVGSSFAGLVFVVFAAFLAVEGAEAFCVYNKTDTQITVRQTSGHKKTHGFSGTIDPGDNKCCNWQNSDCNKEGKKDSTVRFDVYYYVPFENKYRKVYSCEDFPIKAGGWLTIENGKCVAHK